MTDAIANLKVRADTRQAAGEMKKLKDTTKELAKEAAGASKGVETLGQSMEKATPAAKGIEAKLGDISSKVSVLGGLSLGRQLIGDLGAMAGQARELAQESIALQGVFNNLPYSLDRARQSTGGLVANLDLAKAAVTANRFEVATTAKDFAVLAEAGSKLAVSMGQDATKGIEDLTTAIARQSPEILNNLGINLKLGEAQELYAKKLGKSTSELTEQERASAFSVIALDKAREMADKTSVSMGGMAGRIERAAIGFKNLRDAALGGTEPQVTLRDVLKEQNAELEKAIRGSKTYGADQAKVASILRDMGVKDIPNVIEANKILDDVLAKRRRAELDYALSGKKAEDEKAAAAKAAADEENRVRSVVLANMDRDIALAEARGESSQVINDLLVMRLTLMAEEAELAKDTAKAEELRFEIELTRARQQSERTRFRGGRGTPKPKGPTEEEQINALLEGAYSTGDGGAAFNELQDELFQELEDERLAAIQAATEAEEAERQRRIEAMEREAEAAEELARRRAAAEARVADGIAQTSVAAIQAAGKGKGAARKAAAGVIEGYKWQMTGTAIKDTVLAISAFASGNVVGGTALLASAAKAGAAAATLAGISRALGGGGGGGGDGRGSGAGSLTDAAAGNTGAPRGSGNTQDSPLSREGSPPPGSTPGRTSSASMTRVVNIQSAVLLGTDRAKAGRDLRRLLETSEERDGATR